MAFFVLEVEDVDRAKAFLDQEKIAKKESAAGASDFEWHLVESMTV
jgi:hypothetical protein